MTENAKISKGDERMHKEDEKEKMLWKEKRVKNAKNEKNKPGN